MRSFIYLIACLVLFSITSCSKPTSYYTSPSSAGYNQQKLGGICEHCGRQFTLSGDQLHNLPQIQCPYCGDLSDTRNAAAKWVSVKEQIDQQASQQVIMYMLQGAARGINSYNAARYPKSDPDFSKPGSIYTQPEVPSVAVPHLTTPKITNEIGCSSDYNCHYGYRCVKAPLQSSGTCMKKVDNLGVPTYKGPNVESVGPNMNIRGECTFDTDCPIGFRCDSSYKACVKR